MNANETRLIDAGWREIAFAQSLVHENKLPVGVTVEDLLAHGVYDSHTDEVCLTIRGVHRRWKVSTP